MITAAAKLFLFPNKTIAYQVTNVLNVFYGVFRDVQQLWRARLKGSTEAGLDKIQDIMVQ